MVLKCVLKDENDFFLIDPVIIGEEDDEITLVGHKTRKEKEVEIDKEKVNKLFKLIPFFGKNLMNAVNLMKDEKPSKVECELTLGFTAEGNVILVKFGAETQVKVKLTWNQD